MEYLNELKNIRKINEYIAIIEYDMDLFEHSVIIAVSQYMIGKCNTIIKKDKENNQLLVEIRIESGNIEKALYEFNEEVINYKFYNDSMNKNGKIREMILERVLKCTK